VKIKEVDETAADEPLLLARWATWLGDESCARRVLCGQARESSKVIGVGRLTLRELEDFVSTVVADVAENVECVGIVLGD
jgi:hypothetical protein